MRSSLRWRLFVILALSVLVAWTATAFFTYRDARHEIGTMLDARLVNAAELVAMQFLSLGDVNIQSQQIRDHSDRTLQIWRQDGTLLVNSSTASEERMGTHHDGFDSVAINGIQYRIYSHWDTGNQINVRIGERYTLRNALAESVASHLLHPLYFAVPVLGILIWISETTLKKVA